MTGLRTRSCFTRPSSHHMVKRDGVWTCTHRPAQRANDGTPITQRDGDENTESDEQ